MKYSFSQKEIELLQGLDLSFSPVDELSDDEAFELWEAISDKAGFGTDESDLYEDILTSIVKQERAMGIN